MHPLISVSDSVQGAESLHSAFFCIEGDVAARRVARSLVGALGAKSFSINTEDKALYHAAAVMASGHVTALFDIATEMLTGCGLTKHAARRVLLPLLRSTLENLYATTRAPSLEHTHAPTPRPCADIWARFSLQRCATRSRFISCLGFGLCDWQERRARAVMR
jgi:predicted short-subunit dehydrogenase-like oxidoreductase (DUF2520 family)